MDITSVKDEWDDLPRLLAKRKLYMVGLPAICAPYVIDDQVSIEYTGAHGSTTTTEVFHQIDESTTPVKWTTRQREKFLQAARSGAIKLVRRDSSTWPLYILN